MVKCAQCGAEEVLPFQCKFCGNYFCSEHRFPENHDCAEAPPRTPLGPHYAKQRPADTAATKSSMMESQGDFHFRKKESRTPDLRKKTRSLRLPRIRVWYWILLVLFVTGLVLFLLSNYYIYVLNEVQFGWELGLYSGFPLGILVAIGLLYLESWWRRHMRKFWGE